jgi:hypothetical protein
LRFLRIKKKIRPARTARPATTPITIPAIAPPERPEEVSLVAASLGVGVKVGVLVADSETDADVDVEVDAEVDAAVEEEGSAVVLVETAGLSGAMSTPKKEALAFFLQEVHEYPARELHSSS